MFCISDEIPELLPMGFSAGSSVTLHAQEAQPAALQARVRFARNG
jgi:hypothetical protein